MTTFVRFSESDRRPFIADICRPELQRRHSYSSKWTQYPVTSKSGRWWGRRRPNRHFERMIVGRIEAVEMWKIIQVSFRGRNSYLYPFLKELPAE